MLELRDGNRRAALCEEGEALCGGTSEGAWGGVVTWLGEREACVGIARGSSLPKEPGMGRGGWDGSDMSASPSSLSVDDLDKVGLP